MLLRLAVLLLATRHITCQMGSDENKANDELKAEPHIIGGEDAPKNSRPFQVSVRDVNVVKDTKNHICSGSIISALYVLTTAKCIFRKANSRLLVIAGTNDLKGDGEWHYVEQIIVHESFNGYTYADDIGLLKMAKAFEFKESIAAISLPSDEPPPESTCEVSGWGRKVKNQAVKTISHEDCLKAFSRFKRSPVSEKNVCTFKKKAGICQGDSGDPLTLKNELVGVASLAINCASEYPDIFVNVAIYKQWIEKNMK